MSIDTPKKKSETRGRLRRNADFITVAAFLGLLALPLGIGWLGEAGGISPTENRRLAQAPELEARWESWASFPQRSEAYFDDHLGLRESMIRNFTRFNIALFGVSPSDKLIVGREGWLFFGDANAVAHFRGVDPLGPGELARWRRTLEERRDWLAERGIAYLLVLVPDKHEIYAEYLPPSLPTATETRPLDQLASYLAKRSDIEVLDLRAPLLAEKAQRRVYHRTDTHWNDAGAHAAYLAILGRLREMLPQLENVRALKVRRGVEEQPGLGLASLVGLEDSYPEEVLIAEPIDPNAEIAREYRAGYERRVRTLSPFAHGVSDAKLPRAVMFRDSFGNALVPYLSEHFRRILYVWNRDVDPRVVAVEKPDVVIQQIVGRFLGRRPRGIQELETADSQ